MKCPQCLAGNVKNCKKNCQELQAPPVYPLGTGGAVDSIESTDRAHLELNKFDQLRADIWSGAEVGAMKKALTDSQVKHYKSIEKSKGLRAMLEDFGFNEKTLPFDYLEKSENRLFEENYRTCMKPADCAALFVTLSPEPGKFDVREIFETVYKFCKKPRKAFNQIYFCIEQSGLNETIGYHPHAHMLFIINHEFGGQSLEFNQINRSFDRTFKKFMTTSPRYLDKKAVKFVNINNKILYITGEKIDPDKKLKVEADRIWRRNLIPQIRDVYIYPEPDEF